MARLSLREQDRLIRRDWPSFRTILLGSGLGLWHGRVYSLSAAYEVSILYVTDHFPDGFEWAHAIFPEVRVLTPRIERRIEAPDEPIPHAYDEVDDPNLCLFDPEEKGWTPDRAIAETTIPWISDWLRFYEAWQATGVWRGGGRDHQAQAARRASAANPVRLNHRVERVAGSSASRSTIASQIIKPAGTVARWRFIDLLEFARPAIETAPAPASSAPLARLAA